MRAEYTWSDFLPFLTVAAFATLTLCAFGNHLMLLMPLLCAELTYFAQFAFVISRDKPLFWRQSGYDAFGELTGVPTYHNESACVLIDATCTRTCVMDCCSEEIERRQSRRMRYAGHLWWINALWYLEDESLCFGDNLGMARLENSQE